MNIDLLMNVRGLPCLYPSVEPVTPHTPVARLLVQFGVAAVTEQEIKLEVSYTSIDMSGIDCYSVIVFGAELNVVWTGSSS